MEDSSEDNLTTRSLLKGIMATEPARTAVKHQSKKRVNRRPSTSHVHQDENSSSPSMNLRSKMRDRVRRSHGKSALEVSILKRNVETNSKTKPKSANKGSHPIMEDLDKITPRTLLKKIIQNEDEVSLIVSQRSKAADDDGNKQDNSPTAKLSSVGNVNLSLPDMQDTEHVTVFKKSRQKRKMRVSEFEREVDEKLPKNKENHNFSHESFDVPSVFVNSYTISGSAENELDVSAAPESTFKRGLLRRPNKVCLVSLNAFEQGVEDKYQLLKGSQECFIDAADGDKSDTTANDLAQMNTVLYAQSLHKEANTSKSDRKQRRASKISASTYEEIKEANDELLEIETRKMHANDHPIQRPEDNANKDIRGDHGEDGDDNIEGKAHEEMEEGGDSDDNIEGKSHEEMEEGGDSDDSGEDGAGEDDGGDDNIEGKANVEIQEGGDSEDSGDGGAGEDGGDDNIERKAYEEMEEGGDSDDSGEGGAGEDDGGDDNIEGKANVEIQTGGDSDDSGEDDAGDDNIKGKAYEEIEEGGDSDDIGEDDADGGVDNADDASGEDDADGNVEDADDVPAKYKVDNGTKNVVNNIQQNKSDQTRSNRKSTGINEYSRIVQHAKLSEESGIQAAESVNVHTVSVSRPEETSESSESSDDENLDLAESAIESGMAKKKANNQLMLSALLEAPPYIKFARFASADKPAISKKIQRTNRTKPKKQGSVFTSSQVKQIFSHHAQVRVSKEALTDVEKCLDLYVNQLAADLSTYTAHANRKTITRADLELLMKRQRLVTDATSLNVLIEKHLPLECRTLLIPCATSGNHVFPKK